MVLATGVEDHSQHQPQHLGRTQLAHSVDLPIVSGFGIDSGRQLGVNPLHHSRQCPTMASMRQLTASLVSTPPSLHRYPTSVQQCAVCAVQVQERFAVRDDRFHFGDLAGYQVPSGL